MDEFNGRVFERGGKGYEQCRYQYALSTYEKEVCPSMILYPSPKDGDQDVIRAIRLAKQKGVKIALRTGGHQYSGASSTNGDNIQLDLSETFLDVKVEDGGELVTIGISHSLRALNLALDKLGRFVPHGQCWHVHVGGHVQTGGYGLNLRAFGLFADMVQKIRLITADEQVREVLPGDRLFWAILGGSPGNFGVLTHITLKTLKNSDYPHSRGMKFVIPYDPRHLKRLLDVICQMTEDDEFDESYDVCVSVVSSMRLSGSLVAPFAAVKGVDSVMRKHFPKVYGINERMIWPTSVIIFAQWANAGGKDQKYNPEFFRRIRRCAKWYNVHSPRKMDYWDGKLPLSKLSQKWIFGNVREFELPYVKRAYVSTSTTLRQDGWPDWVNSRIRDCHKQGLKTCIQIQPFGGRKSKFSENGNKKLTALSWRDKGVTMGIVIDVFGDLAKCEEYHKESDKCVGHENAIFGKEDIRWLWGSHDLDLHANRRFYYENDEKYREIWKVKQEVDPEGIFSANRFCVADPDAA